MMEFTLSRVTLMICGAILIASVAVPLSGMYEDRSQRSLDDMTEKSAQMIDSFWNSDIDRMYLNGDSILPSAEYSLHLEGYEVTMTDGSGNEYRSYTKHLSDSITISKGESVTLVKYGGILTTEENMSQRVNEERTSDSTVKSGGDTGGIKVTCGPA